MGVFSKLTARAGFFYVYRPTSVLPTTRDQVEKLAPADFTFSSGTGSGAADLVWTSQRTLAASANEDLDLRGSLTDAFGTTLTMVKLKGVYIKAASGNTNDVQLKRAAANAIPGILTGATDSIIVGPGDLFVLTNNKSGWTVTAGTGDKINVANSGAGTSVTYDITVIGTSA
jgi:hypothetical protein